MSVSHTPFSRLLLAVLAMLALLPGGCTGPNGLPLFGGTTKVTFLTDPVTGESDGPFDPATGKRVLTQTGADGILRVVVDPVSRTPVLLDEQASAAAVPASWPGAAPVAPVTTVPLGAPASAKPPPKRSPAPAATHGNRTVGKPITLTPQKAPAKP